MYRRAIYRLRMRVRFNSLGWDYFVRLVRLRVGYPGQAVIDILADSSICTVSTRKKHGTTGEQRSVVNCPYLKNHLREASPFALRFSTLKFARAATVVSVSSGSSLAAASSLNSPAPINLMNQVPTHQSARPVMSYQAAVRTRGTDAIALAISGGGGTQLLGALQVQLPPYSGGRFSAPRSSTICDRSRPKMWICSNRNHTTISPRCV